MKQLRLLYGMAVSALLALGSCASETDLVSTDPADRTDGMATVYFRLGGSAESGVITRAGAEWQDADEKKVSSLLAVIFKDAGGSGVTDASEEAGDAFYRAIELGESDLTPGADGKIPLALDLDDAAAFQFTFVANPSDALKNEVKGWQADGSKTVADFKALVVEQEPATKPMLMTSAFKGAVLNWNASTDLGEIRMTRAMARIDIINQAAGVTIDKLTFGKRAVKTALINDNNTTGPDAGHLETQAKEYAFRNGNGLTGDPTTTPDQNTTTDPVNSCTRTIYTYEQYNHDETNAPVLTLAFHTLDATGAKVEAEHTIALVTNAGAPISFERNHLYRVLVSSTSGVISLRLSVADWSEGEEFEVTRDEIIEGIGGVSDPYANAKVGDIFLSDGTFVDPGRITDEQKKQVIGIVFQRDPNRIGETARNRGFTHGLVMALKNANNDGDIKWSEDQTQKGELKGQRKLAYNDIDGLGNTEKTELKDLTAFKAATAYNTTCPLPAGKTTGWYLPAMGELMDLAANLGGLDIEKTDDNGGVANSTAISVAAYAGKVTEVGNKINGYLSKVGNGNYDKFPAADYATNYRYYWSSSEYSAASAWYLHFGSSGNLYFTLNNKTNTTNNRVRCVFAF